MCVLGDQLDWGSLLQTQRHGESSAKQQVAAHSKTRSQPEKPSHFELHAQVATCHRLLCTIMVAAKAAESEVDRHDPAIHRLDLDRLLMDADICVAYLSVALLLEKPVDLLGKRPSRFNSDG
jgi:hypothetical protein